MAWPSLGRTLSSSGSSAPRLPMFRGRRAVVRSAAGASATAGAVAESWQETVVRSNVREGRLILTASNAAFAPFLRNWLGGLRVLAIDEFVVVSLDRATSQLLAALGLSSHVA